MKKFMVSVFLIMICSGCTMVKYNGAPKIMSLLDYPEVGEVKVAYIGDHLVEKGFITKENILVVHNCIDGAQYNIPTDHYNQIGFDDKNDYFSATGVTPGFLCDPVQALSVQKKENSKLCVISIYGISVCYEGNFQRSTRLNERENSFQQTLIYSGRVNDKLRISYREFSNKMARSSFTNEAEYDLTVSNLIGYKGALIEVIEADNQSITYKLIRNFPIR